MLSLPYAQPEFSDEDADIFYECFEGQGDCFFPSALLTHPFLLNTRTRNIANILGGRGNGALRGGPRGGQQTSSINLFDGSTGVNAGDGPVRYGAWASYSYSDYEDDFPTTAFDGHTHSGLVGLDFSPWERTVFGLAVGYEASDSDTAFNSGNEQTEGYTIAPYFAGLLSDVWSVDFSFGYSNLDIDQVMAKGVTSSTNADRWFWSLNLNGLTTWDNWIFSGRMGTLWARNSIDAFVDSSSTAWAESDSKLGQWNVAGEAAYSLGEWEPYARLTYEYDYSLSKVVTFPQTPSNDRDNFLIGAGVRYFSINGLSGNLEWYKRLGRQDFDEDTISLTIRCEF